MRKQDYLLELIQSLTPNEKRYFKLYANLQPGQKSYLKLYEILEKEPSYDAALISKKLKITTKKLADEKEYLQQVLLRALRNFEQDANPKASLIHRYLEADMLSKRGMREFALLHLDKIYEKIIAHEQYGIFIDCFQLRHNLVQNRQDPSPELVSWELYHQQIAQLNELIELEFLYHEMVPALVNRGPEEELRRIAKHAIMQRPPEDLLSSQTKILWHYMQMAIKGLLDRKGSDAAEHAMSLIRIFEEKPAIKQVMPLAYLGCYQKLAISLPPGEEEMALKVIDTLIDLLDRNTLHLSGKTVRQLKFDALMQKINLLNRQANYIETIKIAEEILDYELTIDWQHKRYTVLFIYSAALLFAGKVDKAMETLREMLKGNKKTQLDIQLRAMLLELMVQYDLKNYSLIPYFVSSIRKWIKRKKFSPTEAGLYLKWMLRISAAAESADRKKELNAFLNDVNAGKIKLEMGEINIKYWLENKLKNVK